MSTRCVSSALALGLGLLLMSCGEPPSTEGDLPPLLVDRDTTALGFEDPQAVCAECHEGHVREWSISNHAYAAVDPVFKAMVRVGQEATEGKLGQFCVQCHTPPGMASGQTKVAFDEEVGVWAQALDGLDPVAIKGVSCDVCHSISQIMEPQNARVIMTPNGVKLGTIKDPVPTPAHGSAYSPLHEESEVCSGCHNVVNPRGALIEETFTEWTRSEAAAEGKTCQDCHMPTYRGKAAPDGPERTLHRHWFVGVDVSLLAPEAFPGYEEMRERVAALLKESARFSASFDTDTSHLKLRIENLAGHALPSGATAERQMWVEAIVTDERGQVVFESGTLDDLGDIRDGVEGHSESPGQDPQLIYYGQQLVFSEKLAEATTETERLFETIATRGACLPMGQGAVRPGLGVRPVTFPWEANWQCNHMIQPDEVSTPSYDLGALPPGRYRVSLRLLFRTFPPYFLRQLQDEADLDPDVVERLPTNTMSRLELEFTSR